MISALGLDPTNIMKRLGDGYYELRLIKDQIAQLTGKRFLDGYGSDQEQYKALMDAGVTYASAYGLRPGVALSSEQIAQLTSDMVWLVEEQVTLADGSSVTALVPKVYMAAKSGDLDGSGALIAANTINVTVEGALNNSGKMYASNDIVVDAQSIVNNQGSIKAEGVVDFVALNDISNLSGSISGGRGVSLVSTEGSVINQTIMRGVDLEHESGIEHYSVVGKTATISSEGGNIVIDAAKNIENIGANISATAVEDQDIVRTESTGADAPTVIGGNISLKAGEEIIIDTAKDKRDYDYTFVNGYMNGESVTHQGGSITADGSIYTQSGGDTTIRGSNIEAGEDIDMRAGGNLNVLAALNNKYDDSRFIFKPTFGKKTVEDTYTEQSVQKSSIKGNVVSLSGDEGVVVQATNIKADDLSVQSANGDIALLTAHYTNASHHEVRKSAIGSIFKKQVIENLSNDEVAKTIIDASKVTFKSPNGDIIMQGSDVQAEVVEIMTNALMLVSDKESYAKTSLDDSQGVMTRKIIDKGKIEESAVPATINAKEIMLNGKSLLDEKLTKENILQTISSEYELTHEQLIQVKAVLNSQEWDEESTSMTALGQIIVVAIVTVITMGSGSAAAAGGTTGATSTISAGTAITGSLGIATEGVMGTAVAASIDAMIINIGTQLLTGVITGELDFDLEAALKSAVLAGALSAATNIIDLEMDYATQNSDGSIALKNLDYGQKISREILHGLAKKAIYGGDIKAIMAESAGNVAFDYIAYDVYSENSKFPAIRDNIPKDVIHGLVGGALSELGGGDFSSGAVSTVVSHVVAEQIGDDLRRDVWLGKISREDALKQLQAITSVVSAAVVLATHENVTDEELAIAQSMGESVVEYNYMSVDTWNLLQDEAMDEDSPMQKEAQLIIALIDDNGDKSNIGELLDGMSDEQKARAFAYVNENLSQMEAEKLIVDFLGDALQDPEVQKELLLNIPILATSDAIAQGIQNGNLIGTVVEEVLLRKIEKVTGPIGDKIVEYGGKYYAKIKGKVHDITDSIKNYNVNTMRPGHIGGSGKIANGHAYDKHVLDRGEFPEVHTEQDFQNLIDDVIENPSHSGNLNNGRSYAYDENTNTLVIMDPNHPDGGTAFRPQTGLDYIKEDLH